MGRLTGLDALRGIAALCVLLFHVSLLLNGFKVIAKAYLAVDFFFMLSGYVMARTFEPRILSGELSAVGFLRSRISRLWPIVAIGCLIGVPAFLSLGGPWHSVILSLLLLPTLHAGWFIFPVNGPAWSIFFELVANAVHGVIAKLSTPVLAGIVLACVPVLMVAGTIEGRLDVGSRTANFHFGFARVLFAYLFGVILYRIWKDRPPIAPPPLATFALMPVLFLASWAFALESWAWDLAFVAIGCPLLIAGGLRQSVAWGSLAGTISFPLYAIHMPLLEMTASAGLNPAIAVPFVLAIAWALAEIDRRARQVAAGSRIPS